MITPEFQVSASSLVAYLDQLRDHIFIAEPTSNGDFRIVASNQAMLNFLRLPSQQVIGKTIRELLGNNDTAERIVNTYQGVLDTGKHVIYEEDSGGTEFAFDVFETSLFRFNAPDPEKTYIGGISRNISLRKSIQESLESSRHKLESKVRELDLLQRQLQEDSMRDPLTGLLNKRHVEEFLNHELARAKRTQHPLSILILDIQNFKSLNETLGHQAGDELLRWLGQFFRANRRSSDLLFRFGGDKFLFVVPDIDTSQAQAFAEVINHDVSNETFSLQHTNKPEPVKINLAIGCASYPEQAHSSFDLIRSAKEALYRAKQFKN